MSRLLGHHVLVRMMAEMGKSPSMAVGRLLSLSVAAIQIDNAYYPIHHIHSWQHDPKCGCGVDDWEPEAANG
jgi:hypothetical protein